LMPRAARLVWQTSSLAPQFCARTPLPADGGNRHLSRDGQLGLSRRMHPFQGHSGPAAPMGRNVRVLFSPP
jgi:hypothetical protein